MWAARFFKTRSLAAKAIASGKVYLNGDRVKSSKNVVADDNLVIRCFEDETTVFVRLLSDKRGPASVAKTLYEETPESLVLRAKNKEARRLKILSNPAPSRRPDKRSRRLIHRFKQKGREE